MIRVITKTKLSKIDDSFNTHELMAGIIYDKLGNPIDRIMFTIKDDLAIDIFNDTAYSFDIIDNFYVDNVVSLTEIVQSIFKKYSLNLAEVYLAYKKLLKSASFINQNLDFFDMYEREVGYKFKTEIVPKLGIKTDRQDLYYGLLNIINYKNMNKVNELSNEQIRK